jgi:transposase
MEGMAMARPKKVVNVALAQEAEQAMKVIPDHQICLRLQAIISSANYPINLVSNIFGTTRQTVWRWIKRFSSKGLAGLKDEAKGHRPPKLNEDQRQQVAKWLAEGKDSHGNPVHWTLAKLAMSLDSEFGVIMKQTPLWRLVRQLGFKQKVPRPYHAKADKSEQESFKKNC